MAPGTDTSTAAVQLLQMMTGYWVSQGVYVAAKLGIADHLAMGPVHYEDLARKTIPMRFPCIELCVLWPASACSRKSMRDSLHSRL